MQSPIPQFQCMLVAASTSMVAYDVKSLRCAEPILITIKSQNKCSATMLVLW